uniref:Proteasome activator Blm10 mid region domain-containing protein n=1 Tax=Parascaris univalens TaxID=6257 RepID=A0A915CDW7_PARUN
MKFTIKEENMKSNFRFRLREEVFSLMEEYFTLLQFAISQEVTETKTKIYAYDPLKELADRLKEKLKACGWDVPEDLSQYLPNAPSTSDTKRGVDVAIDTRIQYSAMLTLILNKLSSAIKQSAGNGAESTTLLSIERIASITSALQFYIPTAVLPYLDEGVGVAVEMRSKIIKYWQPIRDDDDFRRKQLLSAAVTFTRLTECCVQIKQLIVAKFIADYIALNEQLLRLNETSMKQRYEAFILREVRRSYLMHQLFFIMSPLGSTQNKSKPPPWLTLALGRRLSEMIIEADGIANLATALTQEGVTYFENWAFVRSLADVISRRPNFLKEGDSRRTLYHANILKQFIAVMQTHPAAPKLAPWFAASVEMIAAFVPRTVAICFTDSLLHPWEVLCHQNKKLMPWNEGWTRRLDDSLNVLLYYVRGTSPASSMQGIERMIKLFPLWLSLYGSAFSSMEEIADVERQNMCVAFTDDLCCLITRMVKDPFFESDAQKAKFLVAQLAAKDVHMYVEFAFKASIVELSSSNELGGDNRRLKYEFVRIRALPDDNLEFTKARMFENRVTAIVHLLKALDKNTAEELTLKVLSECVLVSRGGYSVDDEEEDEDRFVSIEEHDHISAHIQIECGSNI